MLLKCCTQYKANLENSAVVTRLQKVSFHSNPKEQQCHRLFKWPYNCTQIMCQGGNTQNLQARLQQDMNQELPDVQAGYRKRQWNSRSNCQHLLDHRKSKGIQKNIYFCFIDYTKVFDCVDHNKLWKILKEMGIPDHLTCLLRNLYAGEGATVRTRHGTMN